MRGFLLATILAVGLVAPSNAGAALRSVTVDVTYDGPAPTLNPDPSKDPANQNLLRSYFVAYDDNAGSLTITGTWNGDPMASQNGLPQVDVLQTCDEDGYGVQATVRQPVDPYGEQVQSMATLTGFEGSVDTTAQVGTNTLTASFTHTAFRRLDLRCVLADGDSFYFDGYEPLKLTVRNARTSVRKWLTARYGTLSHAYVKCGFVFKYEGNHIAQCMAEFKSGRHWHYYSPAPTVAGQDSVITPDPKPYHRRWVRKWHKASSHCMRKGSFEPLAGRLYSNGFGCDARMASEIHKGVTGWHGTGTGFFLPITRYRCKRSGKTQKCHNAMGDAFRYTRP